MNDSNNFYIQTSYSNNDITDTSRSELNEKKSLRSEEKLSNIELKKCNSKLNKSMENLERLPFATKNIFKKDDFEIIGSLGRGSYAKVVKARIIKNKQIVAIKIIEKPFIIKEKKLYQIYLENDILMRLYHPNIIKILGVFEEEEKYYIVLEHYEKGDFYEFLKNNPCLPYETSKFFLAQIVFTLEYLHNFGIAHRDLKPENMILDNKFHLKLIDFATAKLKGKTFNKKLMIFEDNAEIKSMEKSETKQIKDKKKNSFVGTAEYVSPEVLMDKEVGLEADLWALGCILYQMFAGHSPFKDKTQYLVFRKILEQKVVFPDNFPKDAEDLVKSLLIIDPSKRIGSGPEGSENDFNALKNHCFFKGIEFNHLNFKEIPNINKLKIKKGIEFSKSHEIKGKKLDIKILKEGLVEKKSPWFHYNLRRLVFYNTGKIDYYDPKKNLLKGSIFLNSNCTCQFVDSNKFELLTPDKTFVFFTELKDALQWTKIINQTTPNLK